MKSQREESNPRPSVYRTAALPTELRWHKETAGISSPAGQPCLRTGPRAHHNGSAAISGRRRCLFLGSERVLLLRRERRSNTSRHLEHLVGGSCGFPLFTLAGREVGFPLSHHRPKPATPACSLVTVESVQAIMVLRGIGGPAGIR